jgi:creatinine amidohydrolase
MAAGGRSGSRPLTNVLYKDCGGKRHLPRPVAIKENTMSGLRSQYWQELSTEEIAKADRGRTVVVIPVAAVEQHGPHLPLGVDAMINEGLVRDALGRLPAAFPVLVLPPQAIGWSDEHGAFSGTLSISPETLIAVWCEIGAGIAAAGFRRLVFFNSHGGQSEIAKIVCRKLRIAHQVLAVAANWYALVDLSDMIDAEERRHGIHAGTVETSMIMHLRPDLVRREKLANFEPSSVEMARQYRRLGPTGASPFGWMTQDLHASGAVGNAALADPEKGRLIVERAGQALADLLTETGRFDLSDLK